MPDAAWAVSVHPPSLSRRNGNPPVLTSSNRLSTRHQRFACARLSQSYLPKSRSDFSATFTTIAFDDSSLRWLEINTLLPTSKGLPSSLVQLRTAVWTGVTRDTMPQPDSCSAAKGVLFDDLVGAEEERLGDFEPERLGGREIEDKIEFGRLLDRDIGRLGAAQNLVDKLGSASVLGDGVWAVGHQTSRFDVLAKAVNGWQSRA